jgi:hypothetical protein
VVTDPIGFNPFPSQYLYQPEGTPTITSLAKDANQQQPGSISNEVLINNKPKSGDALLGKTTKDCKT